MVVGVYRADDHCGISILLPRQIAMHISDHRAASYDLSRRYRVYLAGNGFDAHFAPRSTAGSHPFPFSNRSAAFAMLPFFMPLSFAASAFSARLGDGADDVR